MPNYLKGKIYNIVAPDGTKYIGSTTQELAKRFIAHKSRYKSWKSGKYKYEITSFTLFDEHGIDNCRIELIEDFPCRSKKELEIREGDIIRNTNCVNKVIAGRSETEWKEENKELLKVYWKQYYQDNIVKYSERNKKYIETNREYNRERCKRYLELNRDKVNENRRIKRMLSKQN